MTKTLNLKPRLSEKTYGLSNSRVYVIDVDKQANKHAVSRAVESQFEVKVASVRILNISGKQKRTRSLNGKRFANSYGKRNDIKKAYVTLKEGHELPFFAGIEEEEAKEQATQDKLEKAMTKKAAKEAKPKRGLIKRKQTKSEENQ